MDVLTPMLGKNCSQQRIFQHKIQIHTKKRANDKPTRLMDYFAVGEVLEVDVGHKLKNKWKKN